MPFQIQLVNQIAAVGLDRLPADRYVTAKTAEAPDAILVRSADMNSLEIPRSVKAIGRAGAGTNNIPVKEMSARGVPVFNAPGANANAVKELVLTGLLMAVRNVPGALSFVRGLDPTNTDMDKAIEDGKKNYAGRELAGATLGVIGLGKIGCLVADAAIRLGMDVRGYDPEITVDAAWSLPAQVKKAASVAEVLRTCDIVSLHVPLVDATRGLINAANLEGAERCTVLANFAREAVVEESAVLAALESKRLKTYVCDFPTPRLHRHARVIALPHLGASTAEAEDNCAVMVADEIRDYLENGNITNSVNFPDVHMARESNFRLGIANANVPNMVGQISTALASAGLNISNMLNKSKGNLAYTLVEVDSAVPEPVVASLAAIPGVLSVRYLPMT